MNWEDEGFLLSKRKFRENANIINVFTSSYGKVNGIVYGGTSRKIKNHLQISNKLFVFFICFSFSFGLLYKYAPYREGIINSFAIIPFNLE